MFRAELDAGAEARRFIAKDPTKKRLAVFLGASSLLGIKTGTLTKSTYYFLRGLDDLLDGEYVGTGAPQDPKEYALDVKQQVQRGVILPKDRLTRLGSYALPRLQKKERSNDSTEQSMATLIDEMVFDHDRRINRTAITKDRLWQNYTQTLDESINILLLALGSSVRSTEVPDYSLAQGRLYSVRDLAKDWNLGVINIPIETLADARVSTEDTYNEVASNSTIQNWMYAETQQGVASMSDAIAVVRGLDEPPLLHLPGVSIPGSGQLVLSGLGAGILKSSQMNL